MICRSQDLPATATFKKKIIFDSFFKKHGIGNLGHSLKSQSTIHPAYVVLRNAESCEFVSEEN